MYRRKENAMGTGTVNDGAVDALRSATVTEEFARPDPWLSNSIAPDFLVPAQCYDLIRRRSRIDGEMRLVFAVLEDAVRCYVRGAHGAGGAGRGHLDEVIEGFGTGDARHVPFSFGYVCDVLGIEPAQLRAHLDLLRPEDLPTKQMRSVGRRQVMRASRRRRISRGLATSRAPSG
jgi:hypothetical protein